MINVTKEELDTLGSEICGNGFNYQIKLLEEILATLKRIEAK